MNRSLKFGVLPLLFATACALAQAQSNAPLTNGGAVAVPPAAAAPPATPAAAPVVRQIDVTPEAQPAAAPAAQQAAAAAPAEQTALADEQPGDVTRALMAAQAEGRRAGPGLRLQGPVATAAWNRYLKSFDHPLPEWFDSTGASGKGSGGMGSSQ